VLDNTAMEKELEAIIQAAEEDRLSLSHPYFVRLSEEAVNLGAFWVFYANKAPIVDLIPDWLSQILIRVRDTAVKCHISSLITDELGGGDPTKNHALLLRQLVSQLAPWRPDKSEEQLLLPGRNLVANMEPYFTKEQFNPWIAVGSLVTGEIYAEDIVEFMAGQVRRQHEIPVENLTWQLVHERVEATHADHGRGMGLRVPGEIEFKFVKEGVALRRDWLKSWLDDAYVATYGNS
jgi:pyrroloquinoline quinone (PQQ) biosynthesis protein C